MMARKRRRLFIELALTAFASPVVAGPPSEADDPIPTDLNHWEVYAFAAGSGQRRFEDITTGLDLNYGALEGLQLTATLPLDSARLPAGWDRGLGDVEIGAKYRVVGSGNENFH